MVELVTDEDGTAFRAEVENLSRWCSENNLKLNILKTKTLILDKRQGQVNSPLFINGERMKSVSTLRFLGTHIYADLT